MAHETGPTIAFIISLLSANPTIASDVGDQIYRNEADADATHPLIIVRFMGAVDRNAIGCRVANRIFTRPLYAVLAVTEGQDDEEGDILATAIDLALMGQSDRQPTDGVVKLGIHREEILEYPETVDGVRYNYIGGLYRVFVHRQP